MIAFESLLEFTENAILFDWLIKGMGGLIGFMNSELLIVRNRTARLLYSVACFHTNVFMSYDFFDKLFKVFCNVINENINNTLSIDTL